jgi:hypothetical protein
VLLCLVWWTGLRRRRLYDLPCHVLPLPTDRGTLRSLLLVLSAALLVLEVWAFQSILKIVVADAGTITSTEWVTSEDYLFLLLYVEGALALVLAYRVPAVVLSIVRWLLSMAGMTVLQTAVRHNKPWLVDLAISPRTAVTDYSRTRPAVFGTVAAVCRLDRAAAAAVAAEPELLHEVAYWRKVMHTLQYIGCNSEATLIDFAAVNTACEKGWDAALVQRLLHAWMQSPQCNAAALLAVIVRSKDYAALRAILQMYELCDTRGSECSDNSSGGVVAGKHTPVIKRCVMWLEDCVIAVCELHAVTDRCHLADETAVLAAVAAASTALRLRGRYSQKRRKLLMQTYTELRRAAAQANTAAVTPPGRGGSIMQYFDCSATALWRWLLKVCKRSRLAAAVNCERSVMADTCTSDTHYEQKVVNSCSTNACNTETSLVVTDSSTADSAAGLQNQPQEQSSERRQVDERVQQLEEQLSSERRSHELAMSKRDAAHSAALQQCRDDAAAAAIVASLQLHAVTARLEELEERSVCVVCQHDPKQVLLQPCLH